jgi:hypothetical protein
MKLVKRLTDNYKKNPESNIGKLLSIIDFELDRLKETYKLIDSYRAIDNATGQTLDNIGKNVLQERGGMDDITYRLFLKVKIRSNLSGGQIETINDIMTTILGDNYLGLREVWDNSTYGNEPAAFEIRFVNFFSKIASLYADAENDPYYFNGEYYFDGTRKFDGGYTFSYATWEPQIIATMAKYMDVAEFIRAAGVRAWWCEPLDIETLINIENNVTITDRELAITDISIANDVMLIEQTEVINGATSLFDGMFYFDGGISFDGNRDFVVNDVIITEVSA